MATGSSTRRGPARRVADLRDVVTTLKACAEILDVPYDRLRKSRARNPEAFPTVWIGELRHHRPLDVARFMGETSLGSPSIHETPS